MTNWLTNCSQLSCVLCVTSISLSLLTVVEFSQSVLILKVVDSQIIFFFVLLKLTLADITGLENVSFKIVTVRHTDTGARL